MWFLIRKTVLTANSQIEMKLLILATNKKGCPIHSFNHIFSFQQTFSKTQQHYSWNLVMWNWKWIYSSNVIGVDHQRYQIFATCLNRKFTILIYLAIYWLQYTFSEVLWDFWCFFRMALVCLTEKNPVDNFLYGKKINSASHNEIDDFL